MGVTDLERVGSLRSSERVRPVQVGTRPGPITGGDAMPRLLRKDFVKSSNNAIDANEALTANLVGEPTVCRVVAIVAKGEDVTIGHNEDIRVVACTCRLDIEDVVAYAIRQRFGETGNRAGLSRRCRNRAAWQAATGFRADKLMVVGPPSEARACRRLKAVRPSSARSGQEALRRGKCRRMQSAWGRSR